MCTAILGVGTASPVSTACLLLVLLDGGELLFLAGRRFLHLQVWYLTGKSSNSKMAALAPLLTAQAIGPEPSYTSSSPLNESFSFPTRRASLTSHSRPHRRLAPGLELRLQQLEELKRRREIERRRQSSIGRIPEEQLAELERLHGRTKSVEVNVRRRGSTYAGPPVRVEVMPAGGRRREAGRRAHAVRSRDVVPGERRLVHHQH